MTNTIFVLDPNLQYTGANTTFWALVGATDQTDDLTETPSQCTMQDAGVFSHLCAKLSSNSGTTDPTLTTRVNAGAGAQTITLTHGTTGDFEDSVNTDTVTATQKWNYRFVSAASANLTVELVSLLFASTTPTAAKNGPWFNNTINTASQTSFAPLGALVSATLTTEANVKTRIRRAGTMANLMATVTTNGRAQASTVTCRKNGGNGTLTKSITGSTTGIFEDTAHTDSVGVNDDYNLSLITGTSTGSLNFGLVYVSYQTSTDYGMIVGGRSAGKAQNANVTAMFGYGGYEFTTALTDDNTVKLKARDTFTLSDLTIFVTATTVSATSTLTSRKNAGAGSLTASITASTTGVYFDSTNTESDVATDQLNARLVTGATGTSLTFTELAVWTSQAAAAASVSRPATRAFNLSPYLRLDVTPDMALGANNQGGPWPFA